MKVLLGVVLAVLIILVALIALGSTVGNQAATPSIPATASVVPSAWAWRWGSVKRE